MAVEKMACVVCAYNVKKSLEGVTGVVKVRVALKEKIAVVVYGVETGGKYVEPKHRLCVLKKS